MQLFDFEDSRRKFALVGCSSLPYISITFFMMRISFVIQLLLSKQTSNQDSSQGSTAKLSEGDKDALGSVGFYSNVKAISNQLSNKYKDKGKEKEWVIHGCSTVQRLD